MISSLQKWSFRLLIILFWVSLIGGGLWLSTFSTLFHRERSITIFIWPKMMDPKYIAQFEKQTGIKVYVSYYTNNEELLSKIRSTGGKGYDLIVPSDYAMDWLIKGGHIKKIDRHKVDAFEHINPLLLGYYFDPHNEYSIPYFWSGYGLGVNKDFFKDNAPAPTWGLIFDKKMVHYPIGMDDVPREVISMAAQYLYGDLYALQDAQKREEVLQLLVEQKAWVDVYNDARADDLLISGAAAVVTGISSEIWRVAREKNQLAFLLPEEGGFLVIDSLAIPTGSSKDDLVYAFINFLYQEQVVLYHMQKYGIYPAIRLSSEQESSLHMPTPAQFKRMSFFKNVISEEIFNDMWVRLMAY